MRHVGRAVPRKLTWTLPGVSMGLALIFSAMTHPPSLPNIVTTRANHKSQIKLDLELQVFSVAGRLLTLVGSRAGRQQWPYCTVGKTGVEGRKAIVTWPKPHGKLVPGAGLDPRSSWHQGPRFPPAVLKDTRSAPAIRESG